MAFLLFKIVIIGYYKFKKNAVGKRNMSDVYFFFQLHVKIVYLFEIKWLANNHIIFQYDLLPRSKAKNTVGINQNTQP